MKGSLRGRADAMRMHVCLHPASQVEWKGKVRWSQQTVTADTAMGFGTSSA